MTAWQDPPLTRREARERERRAAREAAERAAGPIAQPESEEPSTAEAARSEAARTEASRPDAVDESDRGPSRRSHHRAAVAEGRPHPDDSATEDLERTLPGRLDHRAQVRDHPEYYRDGTAPVTTATPVSASPGATKASGLAPWSDPAAPASGESGSAAQGSAPSSEAGTTAPQAESDAAVPEHSMTRRELRAMLQAEEAAKRARLTGETSVEGATAPAVGDAAEDGRPADPAPETSAFAPPRSAARRTAADFDDVIGHRPDSGGSGAASSALILPEIPKAPDATGPLTATGEILVTGTIDLPRSLGSTGQHPDRYDSAEMDRMFDSEADPRTSDVEPVRASRAVSSHTSTRGMITPPQKKESKLAVILPVTAAVLAVAVIGLVIAGFVFNVF